MGVIINPESELGKELQKWEQFPRTGVDGTVYPAGNPYVFRPYPKMLYKAQAWKNGKALCFAPPVSPYGWRDGNEHQQAQIEADAFTRSCQRIVKDEGEHGIAKGQGWCETPQEAQAQHEARLDALAREAAEAAFAANRMGEGARREFDAATDATEHQIADVPAPKRQGPRTKVMVP